MSTVLMTEINENDIIKHSTDFPYHEEPRLFVFKVFEVYENFDSFKTKGDNPVTKYCHLLGLQDEENGAVIYAQDTTEQPHCKARKSMLISARFASFKKNKYHIKEFTVGDIFKVAPIVDIPPVREEPKKIEPKIDELDIRQRALTAATAMYATRNLKFEGPIKDLTPVDFMLLEADKIIAWLQK